jgi:hypothetical protein
VLVCQLGGIAWYTFGVYGWDIMEPVTYMIQLTWTVGGYMYFLWNKEDFAFGGLRQVVEGDVQSTLIERRKMNVERLNMLNSRIKEIEEEIDLLEAKKVAFT